MIGSEHTSRDKAGQSGEGLVLLESAKEWILTPKFDPRLRVGTKFEHLGIVWTVTWDSGEGFGTAEAEN
jgi:hypothetical protein